MSETREQTIGLAIVKPSESKGSRPGMGDNSQEILNAGGLRWRWTARVDYAATKQTPRLEIWKKKNRRIPEFIALGEEAQLAIIGRDIAEEYDGPVELIEVRGLGFDRCDLMMGVTQRLEFGPNSDREWQGPEDFLGKIVATSYQRGTGRWLDRFGLPWFIHKGGPVPSDKVAIRPEDGGSESVVKKGGAQAAYEVVSSGDSMYLNHMNPLKQPEYAGLRSEAMLIANPRVAEIPNAEPVLLDLFQRIMTGTWQTHYTLLKYCVDEANADRVLKGVPARQSATLMPLVEGGWGAENLVLLEEVDEWAKFIRDNGGREVFHTKPDTSYPNWDDRDVTAMMQSVFGRQWEPTPPSPAPRRRGSNGGRLTIIRRNLERFGIVLR